MKGHKAHHHGKHHSGHHKASGGRTDMVVSGNPDVIKEAEGKEDYDKGDERKHGGKVKKHHRKAGGKVVGLMTGGAVKPRLDRPGRKSGGRVGSDRMPLSTANKTSHSDAEPKSDGGN